MMSCERILNPSWICHYLMTLIQTLHYVERSGGQSELLTWRHAAALSDCTVRVQRFLWLSFPWKWCRQSCCPFCAWVHPSFPCQNSCCSLSHPCHVNFNHLLSLQCRKMFSGLKFLISSSSLKRITQAWVSGHGRSWAVHWISSSAPWRHSVRYTQSASERATAAW